MPEGRSRTLLWVLIGGGAFFLFVLAVFTLVYMTLHAGGTDVGIAGFGDRIGVVDLDGVILDKRQRAALCIAVENVPGVKEIRDRLVPVS